MEDPYYRVWRDQGVAGSQPQGLTLYLPSLWTLHTSLPSHNPPTSALPFIRPQHCASFRSLLLRHFNE